MNLPGGWETRNASRTRSPSCLSDMGRGAASGGGSQNWRSRERGMIHIHSTDTEIEIKKHIAIAKFQSKRWLKSDGQSLNPARPPVGRFRAAQEVQGGVGGWGPGRVRQQARQLPWQKTCIQICWNISANVWLYNAILIISKNNMHYVGRFKGHAYMLECVSTHGDCRSRQRKRKSRFRCILMHGNISTCELQNKSRRLKCVLEHMPSM